MKKMFLAFSFVAMTVPTVTQASWEHVVDAAVGIFGGIHDYQCRQSACDIDVLLRDIIHEMPYVAEKFAYEDEPWIYDIESRLRGIVYVWPSCIAHHAHTCFVSAATLHDAYMALQDMFSAWRYCRPCPSRCYEYELEEIEHILYDVEGMVRTVSYETCPCQCDFLWRLTRAFEDVTHILRRI